MDYPNFKHFASVDENGVVVNCVSVEYLHSLIEYSRDQSVTNNEASIGLIYDKEQNAFISIEKSK